MTRPPAGDRTAADARRPPDDRVLWVIYAAMTSGVMIFGAAAILLARSHRPAGLGAIIGLLTMLYHHPGRFL